MKYKIEIPFLSSNNAALAKDPQKMTFANLLYSILPTFFSKIPGVNIIDSSQLGVMIIESEKDISNELSKIGNQIKVSIL